MPIWKVYKIHFFLAVNKFYIENSIFISTKRCFSNDLSMFLGLHYMAIFVLKIEFDGLKIQSNLKFDIKSSQIINYVKSQYALVYFTMDMRVELNTFNHIFHVCSHIIILK